MWGTLAEGAWLWGYIWWKGLCWWIIASAELKGGWITSTQNWKQFLFEKFVILSLFSRKICKIVKIIYFLEMWVAPVIFDWWLICQICDCELQLFFWNFYWELNMWSYSSVLAASQAPCNLISLQLTTE